MTDGEDRVFRPMHRLWRRMLAHAELSFENGMAVVRLLILSGAREAIHSFVARAPERRARAALRADALNRRDLFTNSCPSGGNKCRPAAYFGTSGRPAPIANSGHRPRLPIHPPRGNPMSRSQFSRLALCAAALGALAISAVAIAPSLAAEDAVVIPAPAMDAKAADGIQTVVVAGGCF